MDLQLSKGLSPSRQVKKKYLEFLYQLESKEPQVILHSAQYRQARSKALYYWAGALRDAGA